MLSHDLARELLKRRNNDVQLEVLVDDDPTGTLIPWQARIDLRNDQDDEEVVAYDPDNDMVVIRGGLLVLVDPDPPTPPEPA